MERPNRWGEFGDWVPDRKQHQESRQGALGMSASRKASVIGPGRAGQSLGSTYSWAEGWEERGAVLDGFLEQTLRQRVS